MTQGLFTAVSGVRANQTRMDVISNNVANVNTLGYKSSSANFATVFARTITGGTSPNGLLGGTNPRQIGAGTQVGEIAANFAQGGTQFTGRNTDLMISGDGFFAVERIDTNNGNASTDFYLTRAGNFTMDSDGNLVTSAGNRIRGTSQMNGTNTLTLGRVNVPLEFQISKALDNNNNVQDIFYSSTGATQAQILTDFQSAATGHGYDPTTITYGGNLGSFSTVTVELRSFSIGADGSINATYSNGDQISVRTDSASVTAANLAGDSSLIRREMVHRPYEGGDYAATTFSAADNQYGDGNPASGSPNGMLRQSPHTTTRGVFFGGFDQPTAAALGAGFNPLEGMQLQTQTATVTNPAGLIYDGANNFLQGANSGDTNFGAPGDGARGSLLSGALESSNVDIAGEFTNMIITQRGIEAASRVIRSQSEILQTIIQSV